MSNIWRNHVRLALCSLQSLWNQNVRLPFVLLEECWPVLLGCTRVYDLRMSEGSLHQCHILLVFTLNISFTNSLMITQERQNWFAFQQSGWKKNQSGWFLSVWQMCSIIKLFTVHVVNGQNRRSPYADIRFSILAEAGCAVLHGQGTLCCVPGQFLVLGNRPSFHEQNWNTGTMKCLSKMKLKDKLFWWKTFKLMHMRGSTKVSWKMHITKSYAKISKFLFTKRNLKIFVNLM